MVWMIQRAVARRQQGWRDAGVLGEFTDEVPGGHGGIVALG